MTFLNAAQWVVLHRLRAAGCPIEEYQNFRIPCRPVRIDCVGAIEGTNIFPGADSTHIAIPIHVFASREAAITKLRLEAYWMQGEISWIRPCAEHPGCHCLPVCVDGKHLRFSSKQVLHERMLPWLILPRYARWEGFLLAQLPEVLPSGLGEELEVVIAIEDLSGHEYAFPNKVLNREVKITLPAP
jgi:hypothetical protein